MDIILNYDEKYISKKELSSFLISKRRKQRKCFYLDCNKRAIYNFKDLKKIKMCRKHALKGMVDHNHKICSYHNCDKRPVFNYPGKKYGIMCKEHSLKGMMDVQNKKCAQKNCTKQPSYNFKDKKSSLMCQKHALEGVVNVRNKNKKKGLDISLDISLNSRPLKKRKID